MAKTKQQKQQLKENLTAKLAKSKAVVFADYQGLTMTQLSELRAALKAQEAEFQVTKNTVLGLALKESEFKKLPDDIQAGPIATLFAYGDEIAPIKTLVKALKDAQMGKVKAGFLAKDFLSEAEVVKFSTLPGMQELRAQTVGVLVAPLRGVVSVLNGNLRNLVYALDQIRQQKGGE